MSDRSDLGCLILPSGVMEGRNRTLKDYQQAVKANPGFAEGCFNQGNVLVLLGREGDTIKACDEALRLRPDYAEARDRRDRIEPK
jgi:tetratricopeptide (TPR) repeat protein